MNCEAPHKKIKKGRAKEAPEKVRETVVKSYRSFFVPAIFLERGDLNE